MEFRKWIKGAEANGWRVNGASGLELRLRCSCVGCSGRLTLPIQNLGPVPDPCMLPHEKGYSRQTFDEYRALVEELRRKRCRLGLDQIDLNDAAGFADGHISKLESFARIATPPTLALWCQALGVRWTLTPATLPAATVRAIEARQSKPYQETQARWSHATPEALPLEGPNT